MILFDRPVYVVRPCLYVANGSCRVVPSIEFHWWPPSVCWLFTVLSHNWLTNLLTPLLRSVKYYLSVQSSTKFTWGWSTSYSFVDHLFKFFSVLILLHYFTMCSGITVLTYSLVSHVLWIWWWDVNLQSNLFFVVSSGLNARFVRFLLYYSTVS